MRQAPSRHKPLDHCGPPLIETASFRWWFRQKCHCTTSWQPFSLTTLRFANPLRCSQKTYSHHRVRLLVRRIVAPGTNISCQP